MFYFYVANILRNINLHNIFIIFIEVLCVLNVYIIIYVLFRIIFKLMRKRSNV